MPGKSKIEWTDATWNPVTGCTKISPGCAHCYAETFAERWRGTPNHPYEQGFDLRLWPKRLDQPIRWKKPRMIFVNSMSDLFHENVPDDFIFAVFRTMMTANWHTYQVLTKRPERLTRLVEEHGLHPLNDDGTRARTWPAHIWIGVSVETMRYAWRVDELRKIPAAIRFISAEPLLGSLADLDLHQIDWLIAGGESGPGYRPCNPDWIRELRDICAAKHVPFFFKQWGGVRPRQNGRILDDRTHDEYPPLPGATKE